MTPAPAADQRRLLDLQALDTRLAQLAHRRRSLPEHAALAQLDARDRALRDELVTARTRASDVDREAVRAEGEVEQVRSRAERTSARLATGTGTPKELQALVGEGEALARRLSVLEDAQLEVMERQDDAAAAVAGLEQRAAELAQERARTAATRDAALAEVAAEGAEVARRREAAAAGVAADLLALYEKVRERADGLGAAPLVGESCGGCRMPLTPSFLAKVHTAGPDEVVRCEECGRILVRAGEPELRR